MVPLSTWLMSEKDQSHHGTALSLTLSAINYSDLRMYLENISGIYFLPSTSTAAVSVYTQIICDLSQGTNLPAELPSGASLPKSSSHTKARSLGKMPKPMSLPGLMAFCCWSRKWQPTPVFLPGKFHGQRILAGLSPWGCKESDMTERAHAIAVRKIAKFLTWSTRPCVLHPASPNLLPLTLALLSTSLSVPPACPVPAFPGAFQQANPSRNVFSLPPLSDQFHVIPQTNFST